MIDTWYSHFKSGGIAEVRRHLSPMNKNKRKASKVKMRTTMNSVFQSLKSS